MTVSDSSDSAAAVDLLYTCLSLWLGPALAGWCMGHTAVWISLWRTDIA